MTDANLYVVVKGSGGAGLGDRLCGLAVGILLAKNTGRILYVDWRDRAFQSRDRNIFPDLIDLQGIPITPILPPVTDVSPSIWQGRLDLELDKLRAIDLEARGITWTGPAPAWDRREALERYSVDVSKPDFTKQAIVVWSGQSMKALVGQLIDVGRLPPDSDPHDVIGDVLREHVQFNPEVKERINAFKSEFLEGRCVVGVHCRRTNEAAATRTIPTHAQYIRATNHFLKQAGPRALIMLATDNRNVQHAYEQQYGKARVCWTSKWLPPAGESIHKNTECPDGVKAARDALVDIGLLASCDYQILTGHSSFSDMAFAFSEAPRSHRKYVFPSVGIFHRMAAYFNRRGLGLKGR